MNDPSQKRSIWGTFEERDLGDDPSSAQSLNEIDWDGVRQLRVCCRKQWYAKRKT